MIEKDYQTMYLKWKNVFNWGICASNVDFEMKTSLKNLPE